jgi:7-cyano-7-deazaguanine synthase in queuosine biosynthesis
MGFKSQVQPRWIGQSFQSPARGTRLFSQRPGVDYSNTFSPFLNLITLRTVLALMAARGMHALFSADIETAFLNPDLQEEIFMRQPQGVADGTSRVVRLLKSI